MKEKPLSPKEAKERLDKDMTNPDIITSEDLAKAQIEEKDARERVFLEAFKLLFSVENILMISRLNKELTYYLIKHLIIDNFYVTYYNSIKVIIRFKKIEKYPYYEKVIDYKMPEIEEKVKNSYRKFLNELMALTISEDGKGRQEGLGIIDAADKKLRELDIFNRFNAGGQYKNI